MRNRNAHAFPTTGPWPSRFGPEALVPALLCVLCGCGTDASGGASALVRDSAGVTIVENPGSIPPDGGGWSVDPEPRVVIGSFDGAEKEQLYRVRGATRLPDGRIAVANEGSLELRVYDPDGFFLRGYGGKGEGPGEFASLLLAGRWGDSLVVLDRRLRRVSLVHPEEGFLRSFVLADPVAAYPMWGWVFEGGSLLIRDLPLNDGSGFAGGFHRTPVPYRSSDMSGALRVDFGTLPGGEMVTLNRQTEHGLATFLSTVPFGKSPQVDVAGREMYYGTQDAYEIRVYGEDGSLHRLVRKEWSPVPVTDSEVAAFIRDQVDQLSDQEEALLRRRDLEEMPRVGHRPPYGALYADGDGFLFVEEYRMPGAERVGVDVFDPRGRLVGRFEIPGDLGVYEVGEDYLLGLRQDSFGLETLQLHDLTRPR